MDLFQKAQNRLIQTGHAIGEYVTPTLKESAFEEKGVLTPEEFVAAGDQLIRTSPTWQWAAGNPKKLRPYLPADKQYLVTRNVPCLRRVRALESDTGAEQEVDGVEGEEGWLTTHNNLAEKAKEEEIGTIGGDGLLTQDAVEKEKTADEEEEPQVEEVQANEDQEDEDGYINIDEFIQEDLAEDLDNATLSNQKMPAEDDNLVKTRTYDLSITYDKYYQTPRVWLYGYENDGRPLSGAEMFEDIMQDYANKTVTMETHPHSASNVPQASIHPCRHAKVMKKIIGYLKEGGKAARADQYLFIFLKFIQSVIPTIDYDYTIEVGVKMS
mmetsp:Transcript_1837/g.2104  ORF Transcript_1837/g.2104 Transcript_1837/m.2104 type:complete len:326 (+) Transcript_1837:197-1174(+)|eukprot:CAMPEP_0184029328 /NCGR_PEP_ID=MMETSP0955-20130417/346_1 /TAXON_ID=627963 /ORGANISM="Aplanochytrium sp, Strain PBS07" /LENGTH=325 /DNA_ID=CAMNT_0026314349 /DNA_START=144 /DNA_END=1121 /DNA_ORIENTATION=+